MEDIHRSFIATLTCGSISGEEHISVDYLRTSYPGWSGWLMRGNYSGVPLQFRFDYIEHTDDRVHYIIRAVESNTDYPNGRLDANHDGYLGFYQQDEVWDFWKVQAWENEGVADSSNFVLRDHRGYRVGVKRERSAGGQYHPTTKAPDYVDFLSTEHRDIGLFRAKISKYVETDTSLIWRYPNE
jgi:hypothetical protein